MKVYSSSLYNNASGNDLQIDSAKYDQYMKNLVLYGNTSQTTTPSPSYPQEVNNVSGRQRINIVGQNYYNYTDTRNVNPTITTDGSGWITATYNNTGSSDVYLNYFTNNLLLKSNTTYYTYLEVQSVSGSGRIILASNTTSSQSSTNIVYNFSNLSNNGLYQNSFTTKSDLNNINVVDGIRSYIRFSPGENGSIKFRISVLGKYESNFEYKTYNANSHTSYIDLIENNFIDYDNFSPFTSATSVTKVSYLPGVYVGIKIKNNSAGYGAYTSISGLTQNTDYVLMYDWTNISSGINKVEVWTDNSLATLIASTTNGSQVKFNTGNRTGVYIRFLAKENGTGEVMYENIKLGKAIELCKIGDYQDRIFKSKGYNLFDKDNVITGKYYGSDGTLTNFTNGYCQMITINENEKYSLKITNNYSSTIRLYIFVFDKNMTRLAQLRWGDSLTSGNTYTNQNYTMPSTAKYITISILDMPPNETNINLVPIMFNKGTTALPYEPYGTNWYIENNVGKFTFDGTETWIMTDGGATSPTNKYFTLRNYDNISIYGTNIYCNYFIKNTIWATDNIGINYEGTATSMSFRIRTNQTSVNNFTSWLSTHNTNVYYVLATPTYTKITNNDLIDQLEKVYLLSGINNIFITSANEIGDINFDYFYTFDNNGYGFINDLLEAKVTEAINGDYYLEFKMPLESNMAKYIEYNNIIKCNVGRDGEQLFRIKRIVKDFTTMSVYATHLFYDLIDNVLIDIAPTNLSCSSFGNYLLNHANYETPFTFNSNIFISASGRYVRKNIVESMIGNIDNSMLVKFGGEIIRNNFDIKLNYNRGQDNGVKLLFGKNISAIEMTTDIENMATRIIPVGFDGLTIPEKYVDSPLINNYPQPKMAVVEFSDIKYEPIVDGEEPSEDAYHDLNEAYQALRDRVNELYNNGADKPSVNIKIDWVELSKTNEYTNYSSLERVFIGDIIHAKVLKTDYTTEVIKTTYNVLNDRIEAFEIGSISGSIVNAVNGNTQTIQNFSASEILSSASNTAQQQIINALGGTYGQVGGFKISSNKLWTEYYPPADFTSTDLTKLSNYLLDPVGNPLTDEEKAKYDLFGDGTLTAKDLLYMDRLIQLGITTSNPLRLEMRTGYNIMDSAFSIVDGNSKEIVDLNINGLVFNGAKVTPAVYTTGSSFYLSGYVSNGYLTTSGKEVSFTIPLDGVIKDGTPTLTSGTFVLRGTNGYLQNNSEASSTITPSSSGYTFTIRDVGVNFITIKIAKSSAFTGATNNTPVSINIAGLEITFS